MSNDLRPRIRDLLFWLLALCGIADADEQFRQDVLPVLKTYCTRCHGEGDELHGDVNLLTTDVDEGVEQRYALWERAVELVTSGVMPPEDQPQPAASEKKLLSKWFQHRFVDSVAAHPGMFRPRRLSAHEYRNTLHSMLGFTLDVAIVEAEQTVSERSLVMKLLPDDPPGPSGFQNDTSANPLTTVIWDQYSYLSDFGLEQLFSLQRRSELEAYTGTIAGEFLTVDQAERMLRTFMRRAYRRRLPGENSEAACSTLHGKQGAELHGALLTQLKTVLMSPTFLYRGLLMDVARNEPVHVDDFELAERLSYFLWADMPDQELMQVAEAGQLHETDQLHDQVRRMLASPRARNLAEDFCVQWFSLSEIQHVSDNPPIVDALQSQPIDFLHYLITDGRPITELLDCDTSFVNPHTARYYPHDRGQMVAYKKQYGIEIEAIPNQKIQLRNTPERGGLLTMPGVLAMNRGPILRGTWILERILGEHLPDPPPDVGQVPINEPGQKLTFRQRFEQHRSNPTCAVCHDKIDPLGFALQAYDVSGAFKGAASKRRKRRKDSTPYDDDVDEALDSSGRLPSGEKFADFSGLKKLLVTSQRERFLRNVVRRSLSYALCRKLSLRDRPTVEAIVRQLADGDGTFHELIFAIVDSLPFRETVVQSIQGE